jgi:alkaline phosphatase
MLNGLQMILWNEIPNWWDEENFVPPIGPERERNQNFWIDQGQTFSTQKLNQEINMNMAKNLIIFIGDGMGITTQSATRSFLGDDSFELSFEKFSFSGFSKTYCVNYKTGDSSCTATALLNGRPGSIIN